MYGAPRPVTLDPKPPRPVHKLHTTLILRCDTYKAQFILGTPIQRLPKLGNFKSSLNHLNPVNANPLNPQSPKP